MMHFKGLDAIIPDASRILILGSFPGPDSLEKGEYYAKYSNRFWKLIGSIFSHDTLADCSYADKKDFLATKKIALWDVIASCYRQGADDSKIREPIVWNDIPSVLKTHQSIKTIVLNGSTAHKIFLSAFATSHLGDSAGVQVSGCLSTSAANQKFGPWNKLLDDWKAKLRP